MKRALGLILAISMLVSLVPVGFAASPADFSDFPTGWSREAMTAAVNNGLLYGFDNGEIRPRANLTRAEMAAVITRSFGAETKADISAFTDVSPSSWYYDSIAKAVKMGALQGASATEMLPENPITREELFTVFARVLVLSSPNVEVLNKFNDYNELSLWAKAHTIALVERGYVNGDNLGNLNPKAYITREEFAQIMHNAIRTYIFTSGTYTQDMEGITVIRTGDVTIKNLTNTSDLVVGDGAGKGNIYIENVNVGKRLLARGGTITLKNTVLGEKVVVNNVNGTTHFNNYRDEKVFDNIVENTTATFLKRISISTGGSSSSSSTTKYTVTFTVDGTPVATIKVSKGKVIGAAKLPEIPEKTGFEGKWINTATGEEVTKDTVVRGNMNVVAEYTLKTYTVTYKNVTFKTGYTPDLDYTVEDALSYVFPTEANIEVPYGKEFLGWNEASDGTGDFINALSVTNPKSITLYAIFKDKTVTPDTVTLTFEVDGVPVVSRDVDKYSVIGTFPADPEKSGYEFKYWADKSSGDEVFADTPVNGDMTVVAVFELIEYTIEYYVETTSGEISAVLPLTFNFYTYTVETENPISKLPKSAEIGNIEAGYEFDYWKFNGSQLTTFDGIADILKAQSTKVIKLYAVCKPVAPIKITFFGGYPDEVIEDIFLIDERTVNYGKSLNDEDKTVPVTDEYNKYGYRENYDIASVYGTDDFVHQIIPVYYYINDENELVRFDENVKIYKDTKVYLLNTMVSFKIEFNENGQEVKIGAYYNDTTRILDSFKDLLTDGRQQLNLALSQNVIPKYDEIKDKALNLLIDKNIIDSNKNIKITEISVPLKNLVKEATVRNMVKEHIEDVIMGRDSNYEDVYSFILNMGLTGINNMNDITTYLNGLTVNEKHNFATKVYEHKESYKAYNDLIDSLMNKEDFVINPDEACILINVAHAIAKLDYDEMMEQSADNDIVKMLIKLLGEDTFKEYFFEMRDSYAAGFIDAVDKAKSEGTPKKYTTSLTLKLNVIDIVKGYYNRALPKVEEKLENAGVRYEDNKYAQYLVNHDIFASLFDGDSSLATDELTGYTLKNDIMDYYDYMLSIVTVADDALTWYGNDITEDEFNAIYDAIFARGMEAHSKLNDLIKAYVNDGTLPSQVDSLITKISQINDLLIKYEDKLKSALNKYLNHSINLKIENGELKDDERVGKVIDFLFGMEEPTITIDTLYNIFYSYDDKVIAKLKEIKDSGKLEKAVEKFESTSIGELFKGRAEQLGTIGDRIDEIKNSGRVQGALTSVYDMFVLLCDYGIDAFKVPETNITDIDEYRVEFAGIALNVRRQYQ